MRLWQKFCLARLEFSLTDEEIEGLENLEAEISRALQKAGYKTAKSLTVVRPEDLAEDTLISIKKAETIIADAVASISRPFMTAADLLKDEQSRGKLTTNSLGLDEVLDGGIWVKEMIEISGGFSTGKTQMCFQLAVNAQLPKEKGGLNGRVFFLDTEGTFSPKRVGEIAIAKGLKPDDVLKNIIYSRVLDSNQQLRMVKKIGDIVEEKRVKLVIIDSIASHFRTDFIGKEKMIERQLKIMQHGSTLSNLAYIHQLAVVVTNQVVAIVDPLSSSKGSMPALGHAWAHRPHTRLLLRLSPGKARIARLIDSPRRPSGESVFYIEQDGITDVPS